MSTDTLSAWTRYAKPASTYTNTATQRAAASRVIAAHAQDDDDARELLAMLGLGEAS